MQVDILNSRQISVLLTHEDMKEMDIDIDNLDCGSCRAAGMLWSILSKASKQANIKIEPQGEIYIDIESIDESRCVMTFTLSKNMHKPQQRLKKGLVSPLIFQFEQCDHLLGARKALLKRGVEDVKSDLFYSNGKYRLIIYHPFKISEGVPVLSQFSSIVRGCVNVACTKEHWQLLISDSAMNSLLKITQQ